MIPKSQLPFGAFILLFQNACHGRSGRGTFPSCPFHLFGLHENCVEMAHTHLPHKAGIIFIHPNWDAVRQGKDLWLSSEILLFLQQNICSPTEVQLSHIWDFKYSISQTTKNKKKHNLLQKEMVKINQYLILSQYIQNIITSKCNHYKVIINELLQLIDFLVPRKCQQSTLSLSVSSSGLQNCFLCPSKVGHITGPGKRRFHSCVPSGAPAFSSTPVVREGGEWGT